MSGPPAYDRGLSSRLSIRAAAAQAPDACALVVGDRAYRFADLATAAEERAAVWHARGLVSAPARVAVLARPDLDTIVTLYALLELGLTVVPLHPQHTVAERDRWLARVRPDLRLDVPLAQPTSSALREPLPRPEVGDATPLAIVQTSGSRGAPKGVVLSRRAFVAAADASAANLGWQPDDRWLLCMPPAHVGGLSIPIRTLLARRTTVALGAERFDPRATIRTIEEQRVTLLSLVPAMLARLLEEGWRPPRHLRAVLLGGAAAPPRLVQGARERGVPVLTTYGMTETCGQVTTQTWGERHGSEDAGRPLEAVEVRVADGEIQVRGPTCMAGWWEPVEHSGAFTDDGWLRTGDAGWLDPDGRLHVTGRLDERIVTGGENVDPVEVERALDATGLVRSACVFGDPDATWGEVVAAAVVAEEDLGDDPGMRLRAALDGLLAPFKRPRRWHLVGELPATASGKIDRPEVMRRYRRHQEASVRMTPVGPEP